MNKMNYIYYANRANAYLELKQYDKCIYDCNVSIHLNRSHAKYVYELLIDGSKILNI